MMLGRNPTDALALTELYNKASKHSGYQVLARSLHDVIDLRNIDTLSRYESQRMDYILSHCPVRGRAVTDIGGNTGYFTFESVAHGASSVSYFEGNAAHAEFVSAAVRALNLGDLVSVSEKYVNFSDDLNGVVDICFLLNVLHHVGDDFGDSRITRDGAREEIARSLAYMSQRTGVLVFQMGFNWKGDRNRPLFEGGTKREMIEFVEKSTAKDWEVSNVGVATKTNEIVKYEELCEGNLRRNDSLGEFLNRPIFIMKSKWL